MQTIARFALALTVATLALLSPVAHAQDITGTWYVQGTGEQVSIQSVQDFVYSGTVFLNVTEWGGKAVRPVEARATLSLNETPLGFDFTYRWAATSTFRGSTETVYMRDEGTGHLALKNGRLEGYWTSNVWTNWRGTPLTSSWILER